MRKTVDPPLHYPKQMELIFTIPNTDEGGFFARPLGHGIFTEAETWDELCANLMEAISLHFEDASTRPQLIRMHYVIGRTNLCRST
jgi:predicted RNase H-like HicB family nuclease